MGKLDDILKDVNRLFGPGTLLPASQAKSLVIDRMPTGIFELDMRIGGGIPRGRIITLKGEYSTGKSVVAMMSAAQAQSTCRFCGKLFEHIDLLGEYHEYDCECGKREAMRVVWLDAEHSFDPEWAEKWHVDTDKLYLIQTEFAEQAIDVTDRCIRSKECDLVVVDSVAALTPAVEVEESSTQWQVGVMARLMNKALRKWTSGMNSAGLLSQTKCTIILINQMRMGIGGYRPTVTSPGGKGIDFFESVEVRFRRKDTVVDKGTDRPLGIEVEFSVRKNKTAPLSQGGMFNLYFVPSADYPNVATDNDSQLVRLAMCWNLLQKSGSWITMPDGTRYQGVKKAALALRQDPELYARLHKDVAECEARWANEGIRYEEAEPDGDDEADAEDVDG